MSMVKISCPYCGLSKTLPSEKAPAKPVKVNCPKCKHQFPLDPAKLQPVEPEPAPQPAAQATQKTQAPPPPKPPAENLDPHAGLGGSPEPIGGLFSQSMGLFAGRFLILIGLYLLMFIMTLVPGLIFGGGTALLVPMVPGLNWVLLPIGGLITTIAMTYCLFWGYGAFVHAVIDQNCGFKEALSRGRLQIWSFFWALSLTSLLIIGGYFLFFIPGLMFSIWFLFVPFIIAVEKERGMNSLLKSFEYVKGFWWNTFFKVFILTLVCGAVGAIPIAGPFLSLLTTPFMLIFIFTMYYDLQQIKGTHPVVASTGRKAKWITAGLIGYIVLPIFVIAVTGGAFLGSFMMLFSGADINLDMSQMEEAFEQPDKVRKKAQQSPPPQKVLDSNATLTVTKTSIEPGGTLFINYHGIDEPAPKDWIALYREGDPNDQYGEWEYLDSKADGTVTFVAPSEPGIYEARLFLDWPSGGYHDVYRTEKIQVGSMTEKPAAQSPEPASPLDKFRPKDELQNSTGTTRFTATVPDPSKLYVYVYSLNYKGEVRLNGEQFYEIKGEKDMNYNYTGGGSQLKHGENTIDVVYDAIPDDPWMTKVQIKVYTYDFDTSKEEIVAEWVTENPNGKTRLTLDLSP